ncbi:MAG: metal ABC transporter permease [Candidatus Kariarchaeaceae archaeon]
MGYTLAIVSLGAFFIGFVTGVLSVLFVSQKRSIIGDTISHTTLPGITIAFLILLEKNRLPLLVGGLITSILAVLFVNYIERNTTLKGEVAIAVSLSFFVGIGLALLSVIQRLPLQSQVGLKHYLVGNIAFLTISDLRFFIFLSFVVLAIVLLFYKEFKVLLFDREFALVSGLRVVFYENLLLVLVATVIVLSVENMGVVLVAGLLISPAIAARQWSNVFSNNLIISGMIGSLSSVAGVIISSRASDTPPGPTIILLLSVVTLASILIGSKNGMLIHIIHNYLFHRRIDHSDVLSQFISSTPGLLESEGLTLLEFDIDDFPDLDSNVVETLCHCGYCKKVTSQRYTLTYRGAKAISDVLTGGD